MASLLELSNELLHGIFVEIGAADLAALCQTCRSLNAYVRGNGLLHKELYLRQFDEPRFVRKEPDWEKWVHDAVRLDKVFGSLDPEVKRDAQEFVADHVIHLVENAHRDARESLNVQLLRDYFSSSINCDAFLCASSIWRTGGTEAQQPAPTHELRQASAKLHCLYGKPIETVASARSSSYTHIHFFNGLQHMDISLPPSSGTRAKNIAGHMIARAKVYDLREYTEKTLWGPFLNDGSQFVDWEKVEAVMMVLGHNLNKFTERSGGRFPQVWAEPFAGATPGSYISSSSTPHTAADDGENQRPLEPNPPLRLSPSLESQDPFGVTGTWMCVVCFLDYNDLYAFNFSDRFPSHEPRMLLDIEEGIIELEKTLQVTHILPPPTGPDGCEVDEEQSKMDWSNFRGQRMPVVHFKGSSRSLNANWDPNANSTLRGTIRQTPEGEFRWTIFFIFHGEERWRSEGVQVGGMKSARGVLGNWFDKDYDVHGPAGPTAFWKESNEVDEEKNGNRPVVYY